MSLTNYNYGISSMGIPILGSGGIPSTFGSYWFVNADSGMGSDGNDGKSLNSAFATLSKANDMCADGKDDVIVLSGNSAHALTAMLTVSKSRVHFVGVDGGVSRKNAQGTRITMGTTTATADIAMIKVTGGRVTFNNIKFYSTNALAEHLYTVLDNSDGGVYTNCCFEANHKLSTATVAELLCQGTGTRYIDCEIGGDSYVCSAARHALLFDDSVGALAGADGVEFDNCRFVQWTSTAAKFLIGIAADGDVKGWCILDNCQFITKVAEGTIAATYVINPPASLTSGDVLISYPRFLNFTAIEVNSDASGVYVCGPATAAFTGAFVAPHTS